MYLACYDEDLSKEAFQTRFSHLLEDEAEKSVYSKDSCSTVLPHLRLCFDTALSDHPFVQMEKNAEVDGLVKPARAPGEEAGAFGLMVRM